MSMAQIIEQEARLFILEQLEAERDGRSTAERLRHSLRELRIINKPIEWVRTQLIWLSDMGAVVVLTSRPAMIVEITEAGRAHLDRSEPILGVKRAEA